MEFLLNDGGSTWDKAPREQHFSVSRGMWKLVQKRLEEVSTVARVPEVVSPHALPVATLTENLGKEGVVFIYSTTWKSAFVYMTDGVSWTAMPGLRTIGVGQDLVDELQHGPFKPLGTEVFWSPFARREGLRFCDERWRST